MGLGFLNAAMLLGLAGAALPVAVHLLSRRREPVVDWGAMQFLELGRTARRTLRLTEILLMAARIGLVALVALALARPYSGGSGAGSGLLGAGGGPARDVVIVVDGSAGMGRSAGGTTPHARAVRAARDLISKLRPGDSAALVVAGERARPVVDPPAFDLARVDVALAALDKAPAAGSGSGRGVGDIPAAIAEAFRVLGRTQNPAREVVVVTDGRRAAWRPGDAPRWNLLRDLRRALPVPPRVWAVALGAADPPDAPNGSVGPPALSRALVTPGLPLTVDAEVHNDGPGPLTRTAELLLDGGPVAGSVRVFGPLPEGGRLPLSFRATVPTPGSHLLTVRIAGGDDSLAADDEASAAVEVAAALPVLLVDGEPGRGPLGGEADFLRAALAPTGDDAPAVAAEVVAAESFTPEGLRGKGVLVLANVEWLGLDQKGAVARFLDGGGGVLVAPGDRTDASAYVALPWMPAAIGPLTGDFAAKRAVAHPAPPTFSGPVLARFAQGDAPPLAGADLFAYYRLEPAPGASVSGRLDTGEPWAVERSLGPGRGRVLLLAGPLDAEGGTLPVNPDFVPLMHEWAFHLAGGAEPRASRPGEPLEFPLNPEPKPGVTSLTIHTPGGETGRAVVVRASGTARARFEATTETGVYRLDDPDLPGGVAYATVRGDDPRSALDPAPLDPAEAARLAEGWPLRFEPTPESLASRLFAPAGGRREAWRWLLLAALAGLCVEIYLTRKLARGAGAPPGN